MKKNAETTRPAPLRIQTHVRAGLPMSVYIGRAWTRLSHAIGGDRTSDTPNAVGGVRG